MLKKQGFDEAALFEKAALLCKKKHLYLNSQEDSNLAKNKHSRKKTQKFKNIVSQKVSKNNKHGKIKKYVNLNLNLDKNKHGGQNA